MYILRREYHTNSWLLIPPLTGEFYRPSTNVRHNALLHVRYATVSLSVTRGASCPKCRSWSDSHSVCFFVNTLSLYSFIWLFHRYLVKTFAFSRNWLFYIPFPCFPPCSQFFYIFDILMPCCFYICFLNYRIYEHYTNTTGDERGWSTVTALALLCLFVVCPTRNP
jgi:hypothetical protein